MDLVYYIPPWEQYFYFLCPKCNQLSKGTGSFMDDNTYYFKCEPFEFYEEYEESICSLNGLNCFNDALMRDFWEKHGDPEMSLESGYWIDDMVWHRYCKRLGIDPKMGELTDEQNEECDKEIKEYKESYKEKIKAYLLDLGFLPESLRKPCDFKYSIYDPPKDHPDTVDMIRSKMTPQGYEIMKKLEPIFYDCLSVQPVVASQPLL
jgi:hypothetical protein